MLVAAMIRRLGHPSSRRSLQWQWQGWPLGNGDTVLTCLIQYGLVTWSGLLGFRCFWGSVAFAQPGMCVEHISSQRGVLNEVGTGRAGFRSSPGEQACGGWVWRHRAGGNVQGRLHKVQIGLAFGMQAVVGVVHIVAERSEEHTSELQSPCNLVCRL